MKRKRFKHTMRRILQHAASWLLLFTVATACTQDELPEETPEESSKVTLMLQMEDIRKPTTRTWVGQTNHDYVDNVAIIGCKMENGVERIKFVSHGYKPQHIQQSPSTPSAIVRMHLPAGFYTRLVVVANAVEKFPQSLVGQPYSALKQITYDGLNGEGKFMLPRVPMYGEWNFGAQLSQGKAETIGNITLARITAIVNVRNLSKNTFKLERVRIASRRSNALIYYNSSNFRRYQPTLPAVGPTGDVVYDVPATDERVEGMYIYEQPAASFATGKGFNGIRIIAEGTLKSNDQKCFYPIDFVNHDGTAFAPVLRNHVYTFELRNITDDGYINAWEAWIAKEILTNRATPTNHSAINLYNKYYRNVVFNDHNFIATNLHSLQIRGGNRTAHLWLYTDFPGGWHAYAGVDWIAISQDYGNVNAETQLTITCTPTSTYRESSLAIYAGQVKMWVTIQQWP